MRGPQTKPPLEPVVSLMVGFSVAQCQCRLLYLIHSGWCAVPSNLLGGLEWLVLPGHGGLCGFGKQLGNCRLAEGLKRVRSCECLVQALHRLADGDHSRRQRIVKAFD